MYVFMKLQQHGGAVLSSSGEWEALEGGEEEQQALRPESRVPEACPWAWRGWGARGPPRARGSSAPGSGDQHGTGFPGWEPRRAPWSHSCGVPASSVSSLSAVQLGWEPGPGGGEASARSARSARRRLRGPDRAPGWAAGVPCSPGTGRAPSPRCFTGGTRRRRARYHADSNLGAAVGRGGGAGGRGGGAAHWPRRGPRRGGAANGGAGPAGAAAPSGATAAAMATAPPGRGQRAALHPPPAPQPWPAPDAAEPCPRLAGTAGRRWPPGSRALPAPARTPYPGGATGAVGAGRRRAWGGRGGGRGWG